MSETKLYATAIGVVQKFGDDDVVTTREANNQTVHGFTLAGVLVSVKNKQVGPAYVNVTLWPEYDSAAGKITEGSLVSVEGAYTANKKNDTTYHNISALRLSVAPAVPRAERDVVNSAPAPTSGSSFNF